MAFRHFNPSPNEPKRDYQPMGVVAASRQRMKKRHATSGSELQPGDRVPQIVKNKMMEFFKGGKYSLSEIARYCGVSRSTVQRYLDKDPELKEQYDTAWQERIDRVEQSMVELAESAPGEAGAGVIAAEKAAEFLLRYNRKEKYSDTVVSQETLKQLPKIVIPLVIPPREQLPNNPQEAPIDVG